jgi:KUP system potassium uptake protein
MWRLALIKSSTKTLFGTALTMADGILTPAVSVTSSVGGLAVVAPVVSQNIIPISIGFLIVFFLAQQVGTTKLSFLFAPREWLEERAGDGDNIISLT